MLLILGLVRRRQLREKYAFLWLAVGVVALVMSFTRHTLDRIAHAMGIDYGPSALFFFAILFLLGIVAQLSSEVSRLEERSRRLAEEIAIMRARRPSDDD